jgi:uncharacterized protein YgiB involved in biofilm formation
MGKLGFFVGFGAGYVLGSRAGRERYEQIRRLYENLVSSSTFQEASDKAKGAVGSGLTSATHKASEGVSKVAGAVKERKSGDERDSSLSVAPPPN